jgi:hypothetical protein
VLSLERAVSGHEHLVRSTVGFALGGWTRRKDVVWDCLAAHWRAIGALTSAVVGGVLLAFDVVPGLLAPFVVGPVVAMALTTLIAPDAGATGAPRKRNSG